MTASLRYRLFLLTAALLYMGPLVAGLAGSGAQMIPAFTAIFMLWLLIMRPALWPKTSADWLKPKMLARALLWVVVQIATVAFCFGIGRGIGATMGALADVPLWVPPLMSLMAIPLSRIFWTPSLQGAEMADFLDQTTAEVSAMTTDPARAAELATARRMAPCRPLVSAIAALPAEVTDADLLTAMTEALGSVTADALLDALAEPLDHGAQKPVLRRAFVLLATDAGVAGQVLGQGQLARAFDLAGEDAARLRLYADRTAQVLASRHMALMDTPATQRIRDAAMRHPAAAAALRALASRMERMNEAA